MKGRRNEIPPSIQTMAVEGISGVLSEPRHSCGRNTSVVLHN